jgi:hypothetical protein
MSIGRGNRGVNEVGVVHIQLRVCGCNGNDDVWNNLTEKQPAIHQARSHHLSSQHAMLASEWTGVEVPRDAE